MSEPKCECSIQTNWNPVFAESRSTIVRCSLCESAKELRIAIGFCVPAIIRVFIEKAKLDNEPLDVELGEKVLLRIEKAMAEGRP